MRMTYYTEVDKVYINFENDTDLGPLRTIENEVPEGSPTIVLSDWRGNRFVGIEILDARETLGTAFLAECEKSDYVLKVGPMFLVPPLDEEEAKDDDESE